MMHYRPGTRVSAARKQIALMRLSRLQQLQEAMSAFFAGGQQGFWQGPSLTNGSRWQEAAASNPVSASGQFVGFARDLRAGSTRGPILNLNSSFDVNTADWTVSNGTFDSVAGWGRAVMVPAAGNHIVHQIVTAAVNDKWVEVTTKFRNRSGGVGVKLTIWNGAVDVATQTLNSVSGTLRCIARCPAGPVYTVQVLLLTATTGDSVEYDDIEIRELPGNHATQATGANRPTFETNAAGFHGDKFDSASSQFLQYAAGGDTVTGLFYCAALVMNGGAGTARRLLTTTGAANTGYIIGANIGNQFQFAAGTGAGLVLAGTVGTLDVGIPKLVTCWHDNVNLHVQLGLGNVGQVAMGVPAAGAANMTEGRDNAAATNFLNATLLHRVFRVGAPPSDGERTTIQKLIAANSGIAL